LPTVETSPAPAVESGPLALRWNELEVGIPPDSVFQPWMMKTSIKSLEGRPIRITGYMHGGLAQTAGVREFVLLRNIDCPFGREGEAHHAILVELQGSLRTDFTKQAVTVEGIFHVRPFTGPDGNTWALYFLEGTAIQVGDQSSDKAPTEGNPASEQE
jgi:hypothetical protein